MLTAPRTKHFQAWRAQQWALWSRPLPLGNLWIPISLATAKSVALSSYMAGFFFFFFFFMITSSCVFLLDSSILHKSLYLSLNVFSSIPRWLVQCMALRPWASVALLWLPHQQLSGLLFCSHGYLLAGPCLWRVNLSFCSLLCSQGLTFSGSSVARLPQGGGC